MKNRKAAVVLTVLMAVIMLLLSSFAVYSESGAASVTQSAQETVKPGKTFITELTLSEDTEFGSILLELSYPHNELVLKDVSIENKNSDEFLRYYNKDGKVRLIYAVRNIQINERVVKLKWEQLYDNDSEYKFDCEIKEAVDRNNDPVRIERGNTLIVRAVSETAEETPIKESQSVSAEERKTSETNHNNTVSKAKEKTSSKSSSSNSSGKESSEKVDNEKSAANESSTIVHKFDYEKYKDNLSDDNYIMKLTGIVVIVVVVILVAYKFVRRINKRFPD